MVEFAIIQKLRNQTAITDIVNNRINLSITPLDETNTNTGRIVIVGIEITNNITKDDDGSFEATMKIINISNELIQANQLIDLVKTELNNYNGTIEVDNTDVVISHMYETARGIDYLEEYNHHIYDADYKIFGQIN